LNDELDRISAKLCDVQDPVVIGGIQTFHDPLGEDSWSINGDKLEMWGSMLISDVGQPILKTMSKSFKDEFWTITTADGSNTVLTSANLRADGLSANSFFVLLTELATGVPADGFILYHAVGEWDGIS
jgi:hypothetical protein